MERYIRRIVIVLLVGLALNGVVSLGFSLKMLIDDWRFLHTARLLSEQQQAQQAQRRQAAPSAAAPSPASPPSPSKEPVP